MKTIFREKKTYDLCKSDVNLKLYWILRKSFNWQNFEFHAEILLDMSLEFEGNMQIAQSISYIWGL